MEKRARERDIENELEKRKKTQYNEHTAPIIQQSNYWQQSTGFCVLKCCTVTIYINWRATGKTKCTKKNQQNIKWMQMCILVRKQKHETGNNNRFSIGNLGTSRKPNNTAHFHNRHLSKNYYCSAECVEKERRTKKSKTNRNKNINILHFDYCFDWSQCTLHISFICSHHHRHHHYILLSIVIITKML